MTQHTVMSSRGHRGWKGWAVGSRSARSRGRESCLQLKGGPAPQQFTLQVWGPVGAGSQAAGRKPTASEGHSAGGPSLLMPSPGCPLWRRSSEKVADGSFQGRARWMMLWVEAALLGTAPSQVCAPSAPLALSPSPVPALPLPAGLPLSRGSPVVPQPHLAVIPSSPTKVPAGM